MQTAQVVPFKFDAREVRTMLIDDQPWFVAADVSAALEYRIAGDMTRNLDDDEKGTQIVRTLGGEQEMLVINESGLYSAILRSRKVEAKRFKKWVTAEVLPAIRRTGRYEDGQNKMATLVDELIGMTEVNVIKGLIRDKAKVVPIDRRRGFQLAMHNRLHTRFNVPRIELIPAPQFEAACNFVAAYVLEGEWLPKAEQRLALPTINAQQNRQLSLLLHHVDWVMLRCCEGEAAGLIAFNEVLHNSLFAHLSCMRSAALAVEAEMPQAHKIRGALRPREYLVENGHTGL